jgi:hypothetical protein
MKEESFGEGGIIAMGQNIKIPGILRLYGNQLPTSTFKCVLSHN